MSKLIDADRLRAEIEKERKKALDSTKRGGLSISDIETADALAEVLLIIEQLKKEQPEAMEADVNIYRDLSEGESWAEFVVGNPPKNLGDKVRIIIVKD